MEMGEHDSNGTRCVLTQNKCANSLDVYKLHHSWHSDLPMRHHWPHCWWLPKYRIAPGCASIGSPATFRDVVQLDGIVQLDSAPHTCRFTHTSSNSSGGHVPTELFAKFSRREEVEKRGNERKHTEKSGNVCYVDKYCLNMLM